MDIHDKLESEGINLRLLPLESFVNVSVAGYYLLNPRGSHDTINNSNESSHIKTLQLKDHAIRKILDSYHNSNEKYEQWIAELAVDIEHMKNYFPNYDAPKRKKIK